MLNETVQNYAHCSSTRYWYLAVFSHGLGPSSFPMPSEAFEAAQAVPSPPWTVPRFQERGVVEHGASASWATLQADPET